MSTDEADRSNLEFRVRLMVPTREPEKEIEYLKSLVLREWKRNRELFTRLNDLSKYVHSFSHRYNRMLQVAKDVVRTGA